MASFVFMLIRELLRSLYNSLTRMVDKCQIFLRFNQFIGNIGIAFVRFISKSRLYNLRYIQPFRTFVKILYIRNQKIKNESYQETTRRDSGPPEHHYQ